MDDLAGPVVLVGAGGAGSRMASAAARDLGLPCVGVSSDPADLGPGGLEVPSGGVLNPSPGLIRAAASRMAGRIAEAASGAGTAVVMAGLAGRSGSAIAPVAARALRGAGAGVVSVAAMPFRFEADRMFRSGVALRRVREESDCTIVVDNDAALEANPDLSPPRCHEITNRAAALIAGSLGSEGLPGGTGMAAAGRAGAGLEESLRDSLKMLYAGAGPAGIGSSVLHVLGAGSLPAGVIDAVSGLARGAMGGRVGYSAGRDGPAGAAVVAELLGPARFDSYDPLGAIPADMTLDWDEPECSIGCALDLPQLER